MTPFKWGHVGGGKRTKWKEYWYSVCVYCGYEITVFEPPNTYKKKSDSKVRSDVVSGQYDELIYF